MFDVLLVLPSNTTRVSHEAPRKMDGPPLLETVVGRITPEGRHRKRRSAVKTKRVVWFVAGVDVF